jgi:hypothetical protein
MSKMYIDTYECCKGNRREILEKQHLKEMFSENQIKQSVKLFQKKIIIKNKKIGRMVLWFVVDVILLLLLLRLLTA